MAQSSQNDSMHTLHDKLAVLEATLNHYKEKSAQYEEQPHRNFDPPPAFSTTTRKSQDFRADYCSAAPNYLAEAF
jgi:hypothetical protein